MSCCQLAGWLGRPSYILDMVQDSRNREPAKDIGTSSDSYKSPLRAMFRLRTGCVSHLLVVYDEISIYSGRNLLAKRPDFWALA